MSEKENIKFILLELCKAKIEDRITELLMAKESIQESRDEETKSSAGDKYETGRAMMQIEADKTQAQLNNAHKLKSELEQIDLKASSGKVATGSLVITDQGNYFISIAMGKMELGDQLYYCISKDSPIGKLMLDKTIGQTIIYNGSTHKIIEIV